MGLRSRYAPRGPLARGDLFLAQLNTWLLERYRAAEAAWAGPGRGDRKAI